MEITLVTEAFNITEGQGFAELERAVATVLRLTSGRPDREAILVTPVDDPRLRALVAATGSSLQVVHKPGGGYDELKNMAAQRARGRYLAFLDGDCRPLRPDWLDALVAPLREGRAQAAAGVTVYEGDGALPAACTLLDFGFLFRARRGHVGCYASNNVAFVTEIYRRHPAPEQGMRSSCWAHAQLLTRAGHRVLRVPEARVVHQLPNLRQERWRRGYDFVSACWQNPRLPETAQLEPSAGCVERLIAMNERLDDQRLPQMAELLAWDETFARDVQAMARRLRRLDRYGARASAAGRPRAPGRNTSAGSRRYGGCRARSAGSAAWTEATLARDPDRSRRRGRVSTVKSIIPISPKHFTE